MIIGILLIITVPILYYAITESNSNIKLNQADDAVNTIARASDNVYSLGEGSKNYVWITIPSGVAATSVGDKIIQIKLNIFGGVSDIYAETKANVTGSLPSSKGTYKVLVEAVNNGQVAVLTYNDTTAPNVISTSPSGSIRDNDTTLIAITDENAVCKYDLGDVDYNLMSNTFSGTTFTHQSYVGELSETNHVYYVRCEDSSGNNMTSSAKINFTINLTSDITPPFVTNTSVDDASVLIDEYICINATAEDNSSIGNGNVWVMLTSPLEDPFIKVHNYTMTDGGFSCDATVGDNVYGVNIQMQAVGSWYINTSYASDADGNVGKEMPHPNIKINVTQGIFGDFTYKQVTSAYAYSVDTPLAADSLLGSGNDIRILVGDEDRNTPNQYYLDAQPPNIGLFVYELDDDKSIYSNITLKMKADTPSLPYNITLYAYTDIDNIDPDSATNLSITNEYVEGVNRGDNEFVITSIIKNAAYDKVKVRIVPREEMGNDRCYISEVDFGIL